MALSDKKDYVCVVPFYSLEMHMEKRLLCCDSWLHKKLPKNVTPKEAWTSPEADDIRESVLDGSYRYCDHQHCPALHQLVDIGPKGKIKPLYRRDEIPDDSLRYIQEWREGRHTPKTIQFAFDQSCNLKCPSCRFDMIMYNSKQIKKVKEDILLIEEQYGATTEVLYITPSGDPFISVAYRDFLRTFDPKKWPSLKSIHLHTNATYWTKKMWESMPNVHPYVKSCEISIDAATKDTYENKTRLNGNWDELMENCDFIYTIPDLKLIKVSFVMQQKNYKEINQFYHLMISKFKEKASIYYGKITNWGTFTEEQFLKEQIWNSEHPEHQEFVKEIQRTLPAGQAWTNAQEFLTKPVRII